MNVSDETIKAIKELNGEFFTMNRFWDATVGILGVNFVCEQASRLIHEYVAHWYSSEADVLNERCLENFNITPYYPATPAGDVEYKDLVDMMEQMLSRTIDFQNKFMAVRKIADSNDDFLIVVELDSILRRLNEQVAQMILIRDKAEQYGDDLRSFDYDFPSFFTITSKDSVRGV
nr:MAG TPA: hypothetical protein [Caudoviricetes sp.]